MYEFFCCFVDTLSRPFSVLSMVEKGGSGCTEKGKGRVEKVGWDFFVKEMGRGTRGDVREGFGLKKWGKKMSKKA